MIFDLNLGSTSSATKSSRSSQSRSAQSLSTDSSLAIAELPVLTARQKRALVDQIMALNVLIGKDDPISPRLGGRLIQIDECRQILLFKSVPWQNYRGRSISRAEAGRIFALMETAPFSSVLIEEDKKIMFAARFTSKYVRVHTHIAGEWQNALKRLVASTIPH